MDERCVHELLPGQCAVCSGVDRTVREAAEPPPPEVVFEAKYAGDCQDCGEPIEPGELIHRDSSSGYVHARCPDA